MIGLPDFSSYCETACIAYWGEPDRRNFKELRWGLARDGYSGRTYNIRKKRWYDADAKCGGGTLQLIALEQGWTNGSGKPDTKGKRFFDAWRIGYDKKIIAEPPPGPRAPVDRPIRATFPYRDEHGKHLYTVVRFDTDIKDDRFRYQLPGGEWKLGKTRRVLYRLPELIAAVEAGQLILNCEGEKDCETAVKLGYAATCNCGGVADGWRVGYDKFFTAADVIVIGDNDDRGQAFAKERAARLVKVAKRVRVVIFEQKDLTEWLKAGGNKEALDARIARASGYVSADEPNPAKTYAPWALGETLAVFERWLLLDDTTPILAMLGAVAANYLPGDPVWLGIVGPPSSAKTEILNSTALLPQIFQLATFTPAALLSGTPLKQRDKGSRGGLLCEIGEFGILALKDFGSILSLRPDDKAESLAALRELFDGEWTRRIGSGGGRELHWKGKLGLVFASTGVIDSHHSVISNMGDRFLLSRLKPVPDGQFARALKHVGPNNKQMRTELAEAVAHLFAGRKAEPCPLSDAEIERLDALLCLAVRLRGPIERDRRTREIEAIYGAEGTARIGLMIERLIAGLDVLGVERAEALAVAERVVLDSVPAIRRDAYEYAQQCRDMYGKPEDFKTNDLANRLGLPRQTVNYALEDLAAYGLVRRRSTETQGGKTVNFWRVIEDADDE